MIVAIEFFFMLLVCTPVSLLLWRASKKGLISRETIIEPILEAVEPLNEASLRVRDSMSTLRESFFCVEHAVTRTPAAVAHDTAPVFLWRRLARGEALWRAEAASNSFLRATPAQRGRPSRPRPLPGVVTMTL